MPTSLPTKFHSFFWDVDAKKLDPSRYSFYISERLLEWGDLDALDWLINIYGKENVISIFKKARDFSPKTANFYAHLFNIPRKEVRCFQIRSSLKLPWHSRN